MTTVAEPEWDVETRELALALDDLEQGGLCNVCGGPREVCQDPAAAYDWVAEAHRCYRRTAILDRADALRRESEDPQLEAVEWRVARRPESGGGVP